MAKRLVAVRLPERLLELVAAEAKRRGLTQTALHEMALEREVGLRRPRLAAQPPPRPAKPAPGEQGWRGEGGGSGADAGGTGPDLLPNPSSPELEDVAFSPPKK